MAVNLFLVLAASLLNFSEGGVELSIEAETARVDPGRSVFLDLVLKTPRGREVAPPREKEKLPLPEREPVLEERSPGHFVACHHPGRKE